MYVTQENVDVHSVGRILHTREDGRGAFGWMGGWGGGTYRSCQKRKSL